MNAERTPKRARATAKRVPAAPSAEVLAIARTLPEELQRRGIERELSESEAICVAQLVHDLQKCGDPTDLLFDNYLASCTDDVDIVHDLSNHWFRAEFFSVPDRF